jgi:hypothetical protein
VGEHRRSEFIREKYERRIYFGQPDTNAGTLPARVLV